MVNLKRAFISVFTAAAATLATPTWSIPINAGTPVLFNFSGPSNAQSLRIETHIVACSVFESAGFCNNQQPSPDAGTITLFDLLDGMGASTFIDSWDDSGFLVSMSTPISSFFYAADGQFSLRFMATEGSIEAAPSATFIDAQGAATLVNGVAAINTVPEPDSLALFGLGLIGLAVARKRKPASTPSKLA